MPRIWAVLMGGNKIGMKKLIRKKVRNLSEMCVYI